MHCFLGAFDSKHNVNIIMDDKSKEKILLNTVQKQQINLDILKWIILVNRNTISAAELIALALKEEKGLAYRREDIREIRNTKIWLWKI